MRPASTRLLQFARFAIALALIGALFHKSWTYQATVEFIAFVILTFAGVMRLMTSRRALGAVLLLFGLALYPLVAGIVPHSLLDVLVVAAAILLVVSMPRSGEARQTARAILYAASCVAVLSALLILFVSNRSLVDFLNTSQRVNHTYSVIAEIDDLSTSMRAMESMQRAYVLTGAPSVLDEFENHERSALRSYDRLGKLISDNPVQRARVVALREPLTRKLAFMNRVVEVRRLHGFDPAQQMVFSNSGVALMHEVDTITAAMKTEEQRLLRVREEIETSHSATARLFLWVASLISIGMLIIVVALIDRDLMLRKESAQRLVDARDLAVESARAKSRFLANMSHEIRTPMNGIIGMTDLLLSTDLDDEQREFANTVRASADGLLQLLNDILDFSKIEAGKLTLEAVPVDVRSVVDGVIDVVSAAAREKSLDIAAIVQPDVPALVHVDAGRLRQILTNLVGNAVKFTPSGIVTIRVARNGDDSLLFRVTDTGIGIKPDARANLFQSFSQADSSMTRQYGGTGLGLAISRDLVELMGGTIAVESTFGEGSTFTFSIICPTAAPPTANEPAHGKAMMLESSGPLREMIRIECERVGFEIVEDGPADVLIADIPEQSAVDSFVPACDTLSRDAQSTIVLAWPEQRETVRSLKCAGVTVIVKPLKPASVAQALRRAATKSQFWKENVAQPRSPNVTAVKPTRILLAEDNVVNQKVAVGQLQSLGHTVDVVSNGREAVEAVRAKQYDVVLMDCQMPELDGYEATREIRRLDGRRDLTVIAITASAMESDRDAALAAGMNDFVSKPLTKERLGEVIAKWSDRARGRSATTAS